MVPRLQNEGATTVSGEVPQISSSGKLTIRCLSADF